MSRQSCAIVTSSKETDKRHDILKDGIRIGQIYLARAESRKLRYWAISCMSGIGFNTFNEARSYAKDFL